MSGGPVTTVVVVTVERAVAVSNNSTLGAPAATSVDSPSAFTTAVALVFTLIGQEKGMADAGDVRGNSRLPPDHFLFVLWEL